MASYHDRLLAYYDGAREDRRDEVASRGIGWYKTVVAVHERSINEAAVAARELVRAERQEQMLAPKSGWLQRLLRVTPESSPEHVDAIRRRFCAGVTVGQLIHSTTIGDIDLRMFDQIEGSYEPLNTGNGAIGPLDHANALLEGRAYSLPSETLITQAMLPADLVEGS